MISKTENRFEENVQNAREIEMEVGKAKWKSEA